MKILALLAASLLVSDVPGETRSHIGLTVTTALPSGNVPMAPPIDFGPIIPGAGLPGVFDPNSVDVFNKTTGKRVPFALTEDFAYGDRGRLEWAITDSGHTTYEIGFRTTAVRPALIPQTYTPMVGTGDLLRHNAGVPRPFSLILDARLVDLTGDGKRDLVGRWNYAYRPGDPWNATICYPRVGDTNRFEFGDLTRVNYTFSPSATEIDVDGDGLLDVISLEAVSGEGLSNYRVGWRRNLGGNYAPVEPLTGIDCESPRAVEVINDGPRRGLLVTHNHYQNVSFYEHAGTPSGPYFQKFGRAESVSAVAGLSDQAWPCVCDWDGDGDQDLLVGGGYGWPRILINEGSNGRMALSAPQKILSEGQPIRLTRDEILGGDYWHDMGYPYPVYTDWDNDGLPDLMLPNETNRIFWYKNIGTRADPQFGPRLQVLCDGYPDSPEHRAQTVALVGSSNTYPLEEGRPFYWRTGAAFADWNGDGLMDFITHDGYTRKATLFTQYVDGEGNLRLQKQQPLELSDGRLIDDQIVNRTKHWTESFRAVDWDGDGLMDLMYSCSGAHGGIQDGGSIYLLRNCGTESDPVFEPPVTMRCFGDPIRITNHGPHPWFADFDGDGTLDILACVEWSVYPFYSHNALEMSARPQFTLSQVESTIPGDANLDGVVDDEDASILAAHWQMSGTATWTDGDFDGDGKVDDADASILAAHWQQRAEAAVPEPGTATLLVGALVLLLIPLWRKRTGVASTLRLSVACLAADGTSAPTDATFRRRTIGG